VIWAVTQRERKLTTKALEEFIKRRFFSAANRGFDRAFAVFLTMSFGLDYFLFGWGVAGNPAAGVYGVGVPLFFLMFAGKEVPA
jgi:hypothetical protein